MSFTTKDKRIRLERTYPTLVGTRDQVYSRAGATGVSQQFIDHRMQKELGLARRTSEQRAGHPEQAFSWTLSFYVHPGIRREVPVQVEILGELVDRLHALAVGVAPLNDLGRRLDDWCVFHTYGLGGMFDHGKDALDFLRRNFFTWATVEKNVEAYGIQVVKPAND